MQVGPRHTLNSYEIEKYKQAVSSGKVQRSMPISLRVTHAEDQCIAVPCTASTRRPVHGCWQQRPQQSVWSWGMAQVQVQQHLILIKQIARFHFIWCIVPILLVTWISGYSQKTLEAMLCLVQHKPQSHMHLFAIAQLDVHRHET